MNRIKQIRTRLGMSQAALAEKADTSAAQIQRLESGERRLTEEWMRRIAEALSVRPADLLAIATIADFSDELEPYTWGASAIEQSLTTLKLKPYKIVSDSVELAGYGDGAIVLVTTNQEALKQLETGDIVVVEVSEKDAFNEGHKLIARQFISPGLLITNRNGTNLALQLEDPDLHFAITGKVVPGDPPNDAN